MATRLGRYFRAKRLKRGLTAEALAVRLGYRNVRKGARRILRFERDDWCSDGFLVRVTDILSIDYHTVIDLIIRRAASSPEAPVRKDKPLSGQLCFLQDRPRPH
jgi:hypothetical protein